MFKYVCFVYFCVLQDTETNCKANVLKPESDQSLDSPKVSGPFIHIFFNWLIISIDQTLLLCQSPPLDLIDTGKALKVQTTAPHLVSLGSGRLSVAITLLPLKEGKYSFLSHRLSSSIS